MTFAEAQQSASCRVTTILCVRSGEGRQGGYRVMQNMKPISGPVTCLDPARHMVLPTTYTEGTQFHLYTLFIL